MPRNVQCMKLKQEAEGLDYPPYPGELGQRVFENISKEAWSMWLSRQTMFINEYRLNMTDSKAREFLLTEMEKFLFNDDENHPPGFVNPENNQT